MLLQKTIKIPLFKNVEFRLGEIENLPVSDGFIDVIMSNYITFMTGGMIVKNDQGLNQVSDFVKQEYDSFAQNGASTLCCSPSDTYTPEELVGIPRIVLELSSSCGSPTKGLELFPEQTILDLRAERVLMLCY